MLNEEQAMDFLSGTPTGWDYYGTDWNNIDPLDFRYLQMIAWAYEERLIAAQGSNRTGTDSFNLDHNLLNLENANVYLTIPSCFYLGNVIERIIILGRFYINHLYTDYDRDILHYLYPTSFNYNYEKFPKVFQENWIYEHFPEIAKWHSLLLSISNTRSKNYFKNDFIGLFRELKELLCLYKYVVPTKIYTGITQGTVGDVSDYNEYSYGTQYWGNGLRHAYDLAHEAEPYTYTEGLRGIYIKKSDKGEYVIGDDGSIPNINSYLLGFLGYNDYRNNENLVDIGYTWDYYWHVILEGNGWNTCKIFKYLPVNCNYTQFSFTYDFYGVIIDTNPNDDGRFVTTGTINYTRNTYGLPFGFGIIDLGAWNENHHDFTILDKNTIPFHEVPRSEYDGPLVPTPGTEPWKYREPTNTKFVVDGCGCRIFYALNYAVPSGFIFQ